MRRLGQGRGVTDPALLRAMSDQTHRVQGHAPRDLETASAEMDREPQSSRTKTERQDPPDGKRTRVIPTMWR